MNRKSQENGFASYLLVRELFRLLVDVSLVEVGRQRHEAHLGEAKVGELDVAEGRDQQIVWLQVTVHDAERVQVLDGEHGLREVEARHVRREGPHILEQWKSH